MSKGIYDVSARVNERDGSACNIINKSENPRSENKLGISVVFAARRSLTPLTFIFSSSIPVGSPSRLARFTYKSAAQSSFQARPADGRTFQAVTAKKHVLQKKRRVIITKCIHSYRI